jgi:hypothetical protein
MWPGARLHQLVEGCGVTVEALVSPLMRARCLSLSVCVGVSLVLALSLSLTVLSGTSLRCCGWLGFSLHTHVNVVIRSGRGGRRAKWESLRAAKGQWQLGMGNLENWHHRHQAL